VEATTNDLLDDRSRALLDFERESWKLEMPKERAIRERFGFSATRYHQLLNRLIEEPAALAYDPMLVRRLQRVREARRQRRIARQLGMRV
jgi:siderophore synthetase component